MTIAVDIKTGVVVGQVTVPLTVEQETLDMERYGHIAAWRTIRLLTATGYQDVPATSVRLLPA